MIVIAANIIVMIQKRIVIVFSWSTVVGFVIKYLASGIS